MVSVILVGVILLLQLALAIGSAVLIRNIGGDSSSYDAYTTYTATLAILQGLSGLGALVLGGVGLAARGRPKALAGIGLGGGAVTLFALLTSQIASVLISSIP